MTKLLHAALADLSLDRAWVVYPGRERYRLHEKVEAIPLAGCLRALEADHATCPAVEE